MQAFSLATSRSLAEAQHLGRMPGASYIAGGTDLMQLWKNNVQAATSVVDLDDLDLHHIEAASHGLRLGALATMSDVAEHPAIQSHAPAIRAALLSAASPQIRNMGTVGGNLLQRTRCGYFRDVGFACNKRAPGSGCPAIAGENREHAIFGGSSDCIATYASDMPAALVAFDASIEVRGGDGRTRMLAAADFFRQPGDTPHIENALQAGDLILAVHVPTSAALQHSTYIKVRDRQSFAYAIVSVAAGIHLQHGVIRDVRVAAGGVGTVPWRLTSVETALRGRTLDDTVLEQAAARAVEGARPQSRNAFKMTLLQRTVHRALQTLTA